VPRGSVPSLITALPDPNLLPSLVVRLVRPMRRIPALGLVILAACHRAASPAADPARCGPAVPPSAMHPIAMRPADLAGDYDLIEVQSQPISGAISRGRLHLSPLDSAAKAAAAGGAVRDLIGWLDLTTGEGEWRAAVASRDPARPGAVLAGHHLRLGQLQYPDKMAHSLTITAVAPEGFWGWWKADRGIAVTTEPGTRRVLPDPAGYFCALRTDR
jgi:hypothetical protein